uniref:NAC domain-containing protein n=1 Tax=Aegilops tauschii subsp. strangulata TaxID=200361 RepID=A0A453P692_AEGTS
MYYSLFHPYLYAFHLLTMAGLIVQEEGWVVCRVFKKRVATVRRMADMSSPCWFDDHGAGGGFMPDLDSPRQLGYQHHHPQNLAPYHSQQQQQYHCKPELEYHRLLPQEAFMQQLPHLESPKPTTAYIGHGSSGGILSSTSNHPLAHDGPSRFAAQQPPMDHALYTGESSATDWRYLDKFVASQLFSHDGTNPKEQATHSNAAVQVFQAENKHEEALDYASTSAGGGSAHLWK